MTSVHSKRAYGQALEHFEGWCAATGARGFSKATVQAYRAALEAAGLAASSINVRLSAIRKLAAEAADNGWLAPDVAAGVARVKGARRHGVRAGNWLTLEQAERLLDLPGRETNRGRRDHALRPPEAGAGPQRLGAARPIIRTKRSFVFPAAPERLAVIRYSGSRRPD